LQEPENNFLIFADASYDPHSRTGVGAYLTIDSQENKESEIRTKLMESRGIARLELMTVLWAIAEFKSGCTRSIPSIELFTDCQAIENLLDRRSGLESRNFQTKNNQPLGNADLYRQFYTLYDEFPFGITWLKGHSPSRGRHNAQRVFARVDKAARANLRFYLKSSSK
jgi:ribonuclease HI